MERFASPCFLRALKMKFKHSANLWIAGGFLVLALGGAFDLAYVGAVKHQAVPLTRIVEVIVWAFLSGVFYVNRGSITSDRHD